MRRGHGTKNNKRQRRGTVQRQAQGSDHECPHFFWNGAPGGIRTPDHLVRSQVLYPTELRARGFVRIVLHSAGPEGLLGPSWASALRARAARVQNRSRRFCARPILGLGPAGPALRASKIAPGDFVEPPTTWFEARYSIQLSYGRAALFLFYQATRTAC